MLLVLSSRGRLEFGRKQGCNKADQERKKLVYKHKREFKGAVREIRRDNQFLAREYLAETMRRLVVPSCSWWSTFMHFPIRCRSTNTILLSTVKYKIRSCLTIWKHWASATVELLSLLLFFIAFFFLLSPSHSFCVLFFTLFFFCAFSIKQGEDFFPPI